MGPLASHLGPLVMPRLAYPIAGAQDYSPFVAEAVDQYLKGDVGNPPLAGGRQRC
jgi:hypothetical protein